MIIVLFVVVSILLLFYVVDEYLVRLYDFLYRDSILNHIVLLWPVFCCYLSFYLFLLKRGDRVTLDLTLLVKKKSYSIYINLYLAFLFGGNYLPFWAGLHFYFLKFIIINYIYCKIVRILKLKIWLYIMHKVCIFSLIMTVYELDSLLCLAQIQVQERSK